LGLGLLFESREFLSTPRNVKQIIKMVGVDFQKTYDSVCRTCLRCAELWVKTWQCCCSYVMGKMPATSVRRARPPHYQC